jgi:protein SCO1
MKHKLLLGSVLALMGVLVGVAFFAIAQPVQVLPRMALAPGYALVDQNGQRLTNEDLRGSIVLYTFAYTGCGEPCATIERTMREVAARLDEVDTGGAPVRLITISVDPERDTPETLRAAAPALGSDGSTWRLVSGESRVVKQVVGGGFGVFYEPRPDGAVRFDPAFVLVDGWGITRARNRIGVPEPDMLLDQIRLLGNEIRASTGVARYAYEAAHLFSCYAY